MLSCFSRINLFSTFWSSSEVALLQYFNCLIDVFSCLIGYTLFLNFTIKAVLNSINLIHIGKEFIHISQVLKEQVIFLNFCIDYFFGEDIGNGIPFYFEGIRDRAFNPWGRFRRSIISQGSFRQGSNRGFLC